MTTPPNPSPESILIIGSGVFGLSTAHALINRSTIPKTTSITVLSPGGFPPPTAASIDSSRIIRSDYSSPLYSNLAARAHTLWRTTPLGADGRYTESGLVLTAQDGQSGMEYVRDSLANVRGQEDSSKISVLDSERKIEEAVGLGPGCGTGTWGYLNRCAGWADAEAAMIFLRSQVEKAGRVKFIDGEVESLIFSAPINDTKNENNSNNNGKRKVLGARLKNTTKTITATLTILATGASTASILPSASTQLCATAQTVAYLPLTPAEHTLLQKSPVLLNLTTGHFIIPPSPSMPVLKIARHAYGLINPTRIPNPEPPAATATSTPHYNYYNPNPLISNPTHPPQIPASTSKSLHLALHDLLPHLPHLSTRPFSKTRLCWYTDTPTGDFLIGAHPAYAVDSLVLATGGSGHGFKFLPVIGEKVIDFVEERLEGELVRAWGWKGGGLREGEGEKWWEKELGWLGTRDGSRGGEWGRTLKEEEEMGDRLVRARI
ncbi:MAG: hypothetical protein M1834_000630 [Cirrosporium novae-zelandiae]|nr:MAG: hypothetical protein M1834_000630 [Cirrosporium novae-zelandiae]